MSKNQLRNIFKNIMMFFGAFCALIAAIAAYEQIAANYARADDVNRNTANIALLIRAIDTLVEENKQAREESRRVFLRVGLREVIAKLDKFQKRYTSGLVNMSLSAKSYQRRMLEDKENIERQLNK